MDNEIIFVIEESEEGGWTAKALGYSIFTEGDSINELKSNIREAISCHFDDDNFPKIIRLHYVKDEFLSV